jgi:hypothetical protein
MFTKLKVLMKPINQIEQELRDAIILVTHPECKTLEEAKKKE